MTARSTDMLVSTLKIVWLMVPFLSPVFGSNIGNFSFALEFEKLRLYTGPLDQDYANTHVKYVYDFIVVGAGSAGAVVANRLSEERRWNILLLEAGGPETVLTDIPALVIPNMSGEHVWNYKTEIQTHSCLSSVDNSCYLATGKLLGGTSSVNGMVYSRGNRADFDGWASMGNQGWSYKDVLPYFLKSEDNRNPSIAHTLYHSTGGYQTVEYARWRTPVSPAFVESANLFGYENLDTNGRKETGVMIYQTTTRSGSRCSTNKAFLRSVRKRKNLHIVTNALVSKVLIDKETNRVYGVEYLKDGEYKNVTARKEVILSAGAFKSPQLLMLSGIGPEEVLKRFGIPVVVNNPNVGKNLMDHPGFSVIFISRDPIAFVPPKLATPQTVLQYVNNKSGPLSSAGTCDAFLFFSSTYENKSRDKPDSEIMACASVLVPDIFDSQINTSGTIFKEDFHNEWIKPLIGKEAFGLYSTVLIPRSRGTVTLGSIDPADQPTIDSKFLTHPEDMDILVQAIKFAVELGQSEPFKQYGTKLYSVPIPACRHLEFGSDEYWKCASKQFTHTSWHFCGTCKMGVDSSAVVDPQLRVYGVSRLRVVDASVMPNITRGHTLAPTVMIAEKGC